jgi:hypothetical protein
VILIRSPICLTSASTSLELQNLSVIGAVSLKAGFLTGISLTGGTTGDVFLWFIETLLCPLLWPGAVVVMDNLPAHKVDGVKQAIEAVGARLIYLSSAPPYRTFRELASNYPISHPITFANSLGCS